MFNEEIQICNLDDHNNIYICDEDLSNILENLNMKILSKWFKINSLQVNPGKFQFMILGKEKRNWVKLGTNSTEIEESKKVVFLVFTIDNLLTVNDHIDNLNYKLHALRRMRKYLSLQKGTFMQRIYK